MVDLLFRPVFLEALRLLREGRDSAEPIRGSLSFLTNSPSALPSVAVLARKLAGDGVPLAVEKKRRGAAISAGGLRIEYAEAPPGGRPWSGGGEIRGRGIGLRCEIAERDRLFMVSSDGISWERRFLPEGDGAYYAALDERECALEGRKSGILDEAALDAAATFGSGRGGA
jgi:hypothetical protein